MHLFEQRGFHGVTVNQIVEKVGTSKGGFYHHFTSKEELLFVIHDTFITYVLEKAKEANDTYHSPTERLDAILRSFVKVFDLYKPHLTVFYQENVYFNEHYESLIKKKRDKFKQMIIQVIHDGIVNDEFRQDIPTEITALAILGMVNWTHKWYKPSGEKSIEEIADIFIDLILHAILRSVNK